MLSRKRQSNGETAHPLRRLNLMVDFRQPELLLLGLALPVLGWWWFARPRRAIRHPLVSTLAGLPTGEAQAAHWGGPTLRLVALACIVVACAGPRRPDLKTRIQTEGIAIVMVVDVSGSMGTRDFDWNGKSETRLNVVKEVFRLFVRGGTGPGGEKLEGRPTDLIGLVVFAALPDTACPLTLSHSALVRSLDEQKPRTVPGDSETNVIDAAAMGLHRLRTAGERRKVMILLTDGEHNVTSPASGWNLDRAIRIAKSEGVPIHTVDAAGASDEDGNRETAKKALHQLAEGTGGHYFRAENTQALFDVYRAIDAQERERIESNQYRRHHDDSPWFALTALGLLFVAIALETTLWRRVP